MSFSEESKKKRILLVYNDFDLSNMMYNLLTRENYELIVLKELPDTLKILQNDSIGAIVTNIPDFCCLKNTKEYSYIEFLYTTGKPLPVIMVNKHVIGGTCGESYCSKNLIDVFNSNSIIGLPDFIEKAISERAKKY